MRINASIIILRIITLLFILLNLMCHVLNLNGRNHLSRLSYLLQISMIYIRRALFLNLFNIQFFNFGYLFWKRPLIALRVVTYSNKIIAQQILFFLIFLFKILFWFFNRVRIKSMKNRAFQVLVIDYFLKFFLAVNNFSDFF